MYPSTGLQWLHGKSLLRIDYNATIAYRAQLQARMAYNGMCDTEYRDAGHMIPNWMGEILKYAHLGFMPLF